MKLFGSTSDNLSWDIVWRNSGDFFFFFSFNVFQLEIGEGEMEEGKAKR